MKSLMVLMVVCCSIVFAKAPKEAVAFAQAEVSKYVKLFHGKELSVKLGEPMELHNLSTQDIMTERSGSIGMLIKKTDRWYFPVMVEDKWDAVFVVKYENYEWKAARYGLTGLVEELIALQKTWPEKGGYNCKVIYQPDTRDFYFHVPEIDSDNFTKIDYGNTAAEVESKGKKSKKYTKLNSWKNDKEQLKETIADRLSH
jgi:hypothetical protein